MRVYFEMCHNIWNVILDASKVYAHHMVRTDSKARKLDAFLQRRPSEAGSQVSRHEADMESNTGDTSRHAGETATASSGVPARFADKSLQLHHPTVRHKLYRSNPYTLPVCSQLPIASVWLWRDTQLNIVRIQIGRCGL